MLTPDRGSEAAGNRGDPGLRGQMFCGGEVPVLRRPIEHGHYTSREMGAWYIGNGVHQSMEAAGVCWDNAVAESLFSSLKNELSTTTKQQPLPAAA